MNNVKLTQEGSQQLERELAELKNIKRPKAVERLRSARGMGDLSENSEYVAAKEDLSFIDGRILEIEEIVKVASIVDGHTDCKAVSIGNKITVESNSSQEEYSIVGDFEADPVNRKLSSASPIAKALLGKKVGDVVQVNAPAGKVTYKIITIK